MFKCKMKNLFNLQKLLTAATEGNIKEIELCIKNGASFECTDDVSEVEIFKLYTFLVNRIKITLVSAESMITRLNILITGSLHSIHMLTDYAIYVLKLKM